MITEEKLGKYFGKAFKEVVLPALDTIEEKLTGIQTNMATKDDLSEVKSDLSEVKSDLSNMEGRLIKRIDKIGLTQAKLEDDAPTIEEFDNLEKRVAKVERKVASTI